MKQNTPEWLTFRRKGIGSTDASVIMGLNPYKKIKALLEEKINDKEIIKTKAMMHGNEQEPHALDTFIYYTNIMMAPDVKIHPDYPWAFASLDGISLDEKSIVEIKCPMTKRKFDEMSFFIPRMYYCQMQHQMWVTGLDSAYFYIYYEGQGDLQIVNRDEKFIEEMVEKEKVFFVEHLLPLLSTFPCLKE